MSVWLILFFSARAVSSFFHPTWSKTFERQEGEVVISFQSKLEMKAYLAEDVVHVGLFKARMTFGVINKISDMSILDTRYADGILGP
jgi:hypothetical protein